jgi:hypothetical protein
LPVGLAQLDAGNLDHRELIVFGSSSPVSGWCLHPPVADYGIKIFYEYGAWEGDREGTCCTELASTKGMMMKPPSQW